MAKVLKIFLLFALLATVAFAKKGKKPKDLLKKKKNKGQGNNFVQKAIQVYGDGEVFVSVLGKSGTIVVGRANPPQSDPNHVQVSFVDITEYDQNHTAIRTVDDLSQQEFAFSAPAVNVDGSKSFLFTSTLPNLGNLTVEIVLFKKADIVPNGPNETIYIVPETIKFNIIFEDWPFCDAQTTGCNGLNGAYLDFDLSIKGKQPPKCGQKDDNDDDDDDGKKDDNDDDDDDGKKDDNDDDDDDGKKDDNDDDDDDGKKDDNDDDDDDGKKDDNDDDDGKHGKKDDNDDDDGKKDDNDDDDGKKDDNDDDDGKKDDNDDDDGKKGNCDVKYLPPQMPPTPPTDDTPQTRRLKKNKGTSHGRTWHFGHANIVLSTEVNTDGIWNQMPDGYPITTVKNNQKVFSFRFPRFAHFTYYDPAIAVEEEKPVSHNLKGSNAFLTVAGSLLTLVTSLAVFARM